MLLLTWASPALLSSCSESTLKVSSKAKRHDLIKFDIQKFRIESLFQIPISFIDDDKYYLFETNENIHIIHRSGLINTIKKSDRQCFIAENESFRSKPSECFSKFHFIRDQKLLIMYERNSDRFYFVDFKDESKLESRILPRVQDLKTVKVRFVQNYLLIKSLKKISIFLLPQMTLIAEAEITAKYFELSTKHFRLLTYNNENNTVCVSSGGSSGSGKGAKSTGLALEKVATLYHQNFRKIDGLFINSEPNIKVCFFSLTEKMSNMIYVLSYDDKPKTISYLYTFALDYFNITRLLFKPRYNLAVCFDKANKELRIYRTLNIYENRNYILSKTISDFGVDQSFSVTPPATPDSKPTYRFDSSTRIVCQQGIYSLDLVNQQVVPVYKFDVIGIRRFLAFDYTPKHPTPDFACYVFTHEMEGDISTHILIFSGKIEKMFNDPDTISAQILSTDEQSKSVELLNLFQDKRCFRWVKIYFDTAQKTFKSRTTKIIYEEGQHSLIHSFFVCAERQELCIVTKRPENFEIVRAKYDSKIDTLLTSKLTRRPPSSQRLPQRLCEIDRFSQIALRFGAFQQDQVHEVR